MLLNELVHKLLGKRTELIHMSHSLTYLNPQYYPMIWRWFYLVGTGKGDASMIEKGQ